MILNLLDALEVYEICHSCVDDKEILSDKFLNTLISSLHVDRHYRLLELLSGKSEQELMELTSLDHAGILIKGLKENKIVDLYLFCKEVL